MRLKLSYHLPTLRCSYHVFNLRLALFALSISVSFAASANRGKYLVDVFCREVPMTYAIQDLSKVLN